MYEYRQIIVRLKQGDTMRGIAQAGLASRKKVRIVRKIAVQQGWLDPQVELPDDQELAKFFYRLQQPSKTQSSVLPYQQQVEVWLKQGIQASTIHAALQRQCGFTGSYDAVQRFVKAIKDKYPEVTIILDFKPGEYAQVDFGAGPTFISEATGEVIKSWIFIMTLAFSRHLYAEIVLRQDVETWLGCHRRAFEWFGGVPKKSRLITQSALLQRHATMTLQPSVLMQNLPRVMDL